MKGIFYGWWIVFACFLIAFYRSGTIGVGFTAFFEPIAEETGWSYTQISIAASLRGMEAAIFAPIMGFLVDRFGPRKLIFGGMLTMGIGFILLSQANSLTMFYGAFVVLALGAGACASTVLTTAVANWFKRNMGKALAIMSCGMGAGGALVPLIVRLIDLYQWRTTFVILGLGTWLLGIPLSFLVRHRPEQYGYLPDGDTAAEEASSPESQDNKEVGVKEGLKSRVFWHLTISTAIWHMITFTVITHSMPYLNSVGMSRADAALVATAIPLISIIGRLGGGWLGDIFDKRYAMAGAYSLAGAGLLFLSYAQTPGLIIPFLIIFPLSWGAQVMRGSTVREYFGRASFGRLTGIMMGIIAVGSIIGPFLAGWTYDTLGTYQPIWFIFAGISVISVVLMLTMKPRPCHPISGSISP